MSGNGTRSHAADANKLREAGRRILEAHSRDLMIKTAVAVNGTSKSLDPGPKGPENASGDRK